MPFTNPNPVHYTVPRLCVKINCFNHPVGDILRGKTRQASYVHLGCRWATLQDIELLNVARRLARKGVILQTSINGLERTFVDITIA